jgi:hypothetical protein
MMVTRRSWPFAHEGDDGIVGVVEIDPFEPGVFKIDLVQRRLRAAQLVQRAPPNPASLRWGSYSSRFQSRLWAAFHSIHCPKFRTHEEHLLSRMRVKKRIERAQIGKLLPIIPRHFGQQRALAVHHFIV